MEDALQSLEVWNRSRQLTVEIYQALRSCKDYGFKDQITRSAVSVPSNIAEGFERNSKRDFINYLRIARGSCAETRTQLYIAEDIGYVDKSKAGSLIVEALEISKMLQGLINRYTPDINR